MILYASINPLYYTISWTVVHSVWQILLVTLIGGVLQTLLHNRGAHIRYNLLVGIMVSILLSSAATFSYYYINSYDIATNASETSAQQEFLIANQTIQNGNIETSVTSPFSIGKFNQFVENNLYTIVIIWLIGMVMALLRLLGNISYVFYLRNKLNFPVEEFWDEALNNIATKLNVKKSIAILESALVRAPVVIGHLKPIILFPIGAINRLNVEEVEAILAHELAHIKRNDYLVNILINVTESIFYFHPAMWWLGSQIKAEREHCCDDIAIATLGNPLNYAKSLVAVQEMAYYSPQLAMAFATKEKKSQLAVRVNRLISKPSRVININEKGIASIFVLSMIIVFAIAAKPGFNGNPVHCLPAEVSNNSGDEHFLKFQNYTIVDSLYVPFAVNDGDFDYYDALHTVKMKVKDRHVISFNLNGLEIAGTDISKFEKLIFEILNEDKIKNDEGIGSASANDLAYASMAASSEGEGDAISEDYGPELYDEFIENLIQDKLLTKNKTNGVHFNAKNMVINGVIQPIEVYKRYIALFETSTGKAMYGDVGISFRVMIDKAGKVGTLNLEQPEPPSPPSKLSNTSRVSPPSPPSSSSSSSGYSYSTGNQVAQHNTYNGSKDEAFDLWLDNELVKDGYIQNKNQFNYYWDAKGMMVDGIAVSKEDRQKYLNKRKEMTGYELTTSFLKTRNVTKD